jgi:hypothetical protein
MNPAASAFPVACCGVSERIGNSIIPYGSKILRSLLRRASITHIFGITRDILTVIRDPLQVDQQFNENGTCLGMADPLIKSFLMSFS